MHTMARALHSAGTGLPAGPQRSTFSTYTRQLSPRPRSLVERHVSFTPPLNDTTTLAMSPAFSPMTAGSAGSKGGRPRDWTDARERRLMRLYLHSRASWAVMLAALAEPDFVPQKDAANKRLNARLGNDCRWLRPKDWNETHRLIHSLDNSTRLVYRQPRNPQEIGVPEAYDYQTGTFITQPEDLAIGVQSATPENFVQAQAHWYSAAQEPALTSQDYLKSPDAFIFQGAAKPAQHLRRETNLSNHSVASMTNSFVEKLQVLMKKEPEEEVPSMIGSIWKLTKRFTYPRLSDPISFGTQSPYAGLTPAQRVFPSTLVGNETNLAAARHSLPGSQIGASLVQAFHTGEPSATRNWNGIVVSAVDEFGNTPLHFLASREDCRTQLNGIIWQISENRPALLDSINTGGQTFLHVLHDSWFAGDPQLDQLINMLKNLRPQLLTRRDAYGRNIFHVMREHGMELGQICFLARDFDLSTLDTRDAFGTIPLQPPKSPLAELMSRKVKCIVNAQRLVTQPSPPNLSPLETDSMIVTHTKLVKLIRLATSFDTEEGGPRAEDLRGRNGFHALAQLIVGAKSLQEQELASRGQKRKQGTDPVGEEEMSLKAPELEKIEHLDALIHAKVDINHHDRDDGNTPLMAFIKHLPEAAKEDVSQVRSIIQRLVQAGSDMERRNRRGETALHVAARLGQKVAVDTLLLLGANVSARDSVGRGVLEVVDREIEASDGDPGIYGPLEACRVLLAGRRTRFGAKPFPTFEDEWNFGTRKL